MGKLRVRRPRGIWERQKGKKVPFGKVDEFVMINVTYTHKNHAINGIECDCSPTPCMQGVIGDMREVVVVDTREVERWGS